MEIREKLKQTAMERGGDARVTDVRIGLGYTAVMLENGSVGVAYTFLSQHKGSCTVFRGLRPISGRNAADLLKLFDSANEVESAVALATCNAIMNTDRNDYLVGDILAHLQLDSEDVVGMVGHFAPIVAELKKRVKEVKIFEEVRHPTGNLLPSSQIPEILPQCQVALISSTSIINSTIESILQASKACKAVAMLGGSTPLVEEVFRDTPVTLLSGVVVTDPMGMLQVVSEGGGTRAFREFTKKVNLKID